MRSLRQALRRWLKDADFRGVCGDALAKLPQAEREPWQQLWAAVEKTLRTATLKNAKEKKPSN
jgi:hypothetical protein